VEREGCLSLPRSGGKKQVDDCQVQITVLAGIRWYCLNLERMRQKPSDAYFRT